MVICGSTEAQRLVQSLRLGMLVVGPEALPVFLFLTARLRHEINNLIQAKLMLAAIIDATKMLFRWLMSAATASWSIRPIPV